jgi:hypothetical protein
MKAGTDTVRQVNGIPDTPRYSRHLGRIVGSRVIISYASFSRLSEWRRGKYTPTPKVASQMLFDTLPWAMEKAGISVTREQQDALDDLLWNFTVTDGNRQIKFK